MSTGPPAPDEPMPVGPAELLSVRPDGGMSVLVSACLTGPARCGTTRIVAVDGRSGAGKSRLADALVEALRERRRAGAIAGPVELVRLDDAYPGWDGLLAVVPLLRRWLLQPLASGHPAGVHRYDWTRGTFGAWCPVTGGGVLVLEGVGSGAAELAGHRSLLIWVEAADPVRRDRAIARDGELLARHWGRWAAQEAEYLRRDDPRAHADLVVDTTQRELTPIIGSKSRRPGRDGLDSVEG